MRPGEMIDIWVVEKALGAGGMGSVYRCHNRSAKRILAAIKVLDPALRRVAGSEERFVREAEILFTLDHPNIVRVRNIRIDGEPPYLEMEFVEGDSLDKILQRGPLPWRRALPILAQLTEALAYLHGRGVRHRDVKPANVLVRPDGRTCLVDFGLAMETDQSRLTQSNTTFGTVSYAPPEWIDPDAMDPEKWDLYSVGVVAWEMLRGQVAFPVSGKGSPRQQAMQVIIAKQNHPALDPGDAFHDDLRALVRDLTEPDATRRPTSMAIVRDRVKALDPSTPVRASGETLAPAPTGPPTPNEGPPTPTEESPAMRTAWAKALEDTPVPAEPKAFRRGSEAQTLLTGPPRVGAGRSLLAVGLLVVIGLATVTAIVALGPWGGQAPPTARPVEVVVGGLAPGTEVSLLLDGEPARSRTSWVWRFGDRAPGAHAATWAVGVGCGPPLCPGETCPPWCATGETVIDVVPGTGVLSTALVLPSPAARTVRVALPEEVGPEVALVRLGDLSRSTPGSVATFDGVMPGPWPVEVVMGACPSVARGCASIGDCPAGCASWLGEAAVPWGDGPWTLHAAVPASSVPASPGPATEPAPTQSLVVATAPQPPPVPVVEPEPAGAAGRAVRVEAFAAWLAANPDWHREAAIAGGRADQGYLPGWAGGHAPPGGEGHAIRDVSWYAASAYCRDHGGLADLAAEPTTWTEGVGQPYLEWRVSDGRAAWRSGDGQSSTKVRMNEANSFTGFRCAR